MKRYLCVVLGLLWTLAGLSGAEPVPEVSIKSLKATGEIQGENISFVLDLTVEVARRGAVLDLARGAMVLLSSQLPGRTTVDRNGDLYSLRFPSRGEQHAVLKFAVVAARQDDWRSAAFSLPNAVVREVAMVCDREDLEIKFGGALQTDRRKNAAGKTEVVAYLTSGAGVNVRWKPQVRKLEGELAVTCDGRTVAVASVGALKLDTLFTYRVVQGLLDKMSLDVPDGLNVTQVLGDDIREWRLEAKPTGGRELKVVLSRPKDKLYALRVEGERVLPAFPCKFDLPVVVPAGVIRASGFLLLGTDSAAKLLVGRAAGLSQIDPGAFPAGAAGGQMLPSRASYAYQYAHMPFQMELSAEDIVTVLTSDERLTVAYEDNGVSIEAALDIDVRDAPTREVILETDPAWGVAQVQGAKVADYDVRDAAGKRDIRITFQDAILGHVLLNLRLERTLGQGAGTFTVPRLAVREARAERGYLVLRAEKGVRLKEQKAEGVREIHTASLPFRVADAQRAYRYKEANWSLQVQIEQADAALHAELFHLVSLGEGALYGSVSITYRIEGAPVRRFTVKIPDTYQNIEFTGRDIRGWERDGESVTVSLQEKVLGDYTLLLTYDQPFAYEGAELLAGGVETTGTMSEVGYVALSGPASLTFDAEKQRDPSVISIAPEELPREYGLLVNDPVLKAYKYVRAPHVTRLQLRRYSTQPLLDRVADHISLRTHLSLEGEAVTEATYFVKNTSQQFLGITLPQGARLWSTRVDGETVRVLDDGKGMILIPIKRLLDANTPSRVDLSYAESRPRLQWFRRVTFSAPSSGTQAVFARWTLTVPEKLAIQPSGGNMTGPLLPGKGLGRLLDAVAALMKGLGRNAGAFVAGAVMLAVLAGGVAYRAGRRSLASWGGAGILLLVVCAVLYTGFSGLCAMEGLTREWGGVARAPHAVLRELSFTKSVTLSDHELSVGARILPSWLSGTGGLVRLAAGGLLGLLLLARAWIRRGQPWLGAAGLTLLVWSLTAIPALVNVVAVGVVAGVPLAVCAGWFRWAYEAGRARRSPATPETSEPWPPPFAPVPENGPDAGGTSAASGRASIGLLLVLAVAMAAGGLGRAWAGDKPAVRAVAAPPAEPPCPMMKEVGLKIQAPDPLKERDGIARIELSLVFSVEKPVSFQVLPADYVLIESTVTPKDGRIEGTANGYVLHVTRQGDHVLTFKGYAPVGSLDGIWRLPVNLPPHLRNHVEVSIPATGWEVSASQVAWLDIREQGKTTTGSLTLASAGPGFILWQPRERKTRLEQVVFYCDLQTYAVLAPGVVNMTHLAHCQVAQGEVQTLRFTIPEGMTVTAVGGAGLGTWRFEPETRLLEALMEKPVNGELTLAITTQIPREGLPYDVSMMLPGVEGCTRQRGSLALSAGGAVQVRVDSVKGLSPMNTGDFPDEAVQSALKGAHYAELPEIKRAYRYHELPVNATVHAERVQPEVRVVEQANLDISDERLALSSRLSLSIARAGIFDLRLDLPESFDIESLTGDDISHWDEVRDGGHGVIVHFQKQALGTRVVNLVLSRMEKGIEAQIKAPRIGVRDVVKHVGTLAVSGERGVRFLTAEREGVSEVHPRELSIEQPGYLAFRLLRPDWSVTLRAEMLAPVLRADVLQRLDIAEGMIYGRCLIQYKIDQAGVKTFRLKAPAPGVALTISGRSIAKVSEVDREAGLWEVELQGKVENRYALDVSYQQACDPASGVLNVVPLQTVGTDSQKGYVVGFTAGRLQVRPGTTPDGLHEDDARNVPATFGAGDLSDAILCYRTTRPDYALALSVIRHDAADVLPVRVRSVRMASVLAEDGQMVTRVEMQLNVGSLRFLEVALPAGAQAWSAFVNGAAAAPLKDRGKLLVPLEAAKTVGDATVELTYVAPFGGGSVFGRQRIEGPRFNVPLADVRWDLYAPPGYRYSGFGGTMTYNKDWCQDGVIAFDATQYEQQTRNAVLASNTKAEEVLKKGESLWQQGKQAEAKQALKQAVVFSQGQQTLNEDARIQYRNLMRQQAVVGFSNRRAALKKAKNVVDSYEAAGSGQPEAPMQQVDQGQWTADYGRQVEQSLGAKDADNLNGIADKMLEQQVAAQMRANPIRVTLPVQGVHVPFYRELQIHPGSEMRVEFKAGSRRLTGWLVSAAVAAGLLLVFRSLLRLFATPQA
jgi:hypothetical protein